MATQEGTTTRPNIVFILVDNVGWGGFGVYGGTTPTPRIDKLASEGIRFNNYNVEVPVHADALGDHDRATSGSLGNLQVPFPGQGRSGWRRGNTPSPNSSPTRAMPPRCTASGIWVRPRPAAERPRLRRMVGHQEQLG